MLWIRPQLAVLPWVQGPAQLQLLALRRVPALPGTRQRALSGPEGNLHIATRPAGSPQLGRTYRSTVSWVGHDQRIKSHESPVSQRQRCCEEGTGVRQVRKGLNCSGSHLRSRSPLRLWSPAPVRGKPRLSQL
ncbi:hypothetical protein NN561_009104 [Cricetulus griseus]